MNLGFRLYDPVTGRFLSVDPLAELQIGITPYHYCGNDPVNASDRSGLNESRGHLQEEEYRNNAIEQNRESLLTIAGNSYNEWVKATDQRVFNGMLIDEERIIDMKSWVERHKCSYGEGGGKEEKACQLELKKTNQKSKLSTEGCTLTFDGVTLRFYDKKGIVGSWYAVSGPLTKGRSDPSTQDRDGGAIPESDNYFIDTANDWNGRGVGDEPTSLNQIIPVINA